MFVYLEYLLLSSGPSLSLLVPSLRPATDIETACVSSKVAVLAAEFNTCLYFEPSLGREEMIVRGH